MERGWKNSVSMATFYVLYSSSLDWPCAFFFLLLLLQPQVGSVILSFPPYWSAAVSLSNKRQITDVFRTVEYVVCGPHSFSPFYSHYLWFVELDCISPFGRGDPEKHVSTSTPSIYFYQTQNKSIINILHQVLSLNRRGHVVRRRTQAAETVDAHIRQIFKFFPAVN